jgi:hypothetical protein
LRVRCVRDKLSSALRRAFLARPQEATVPRAIIHTKADLSIPVDDWRVLKHNVSERKVVQVVVAHTHETSILDRTGVLKVCLFPRYQFGNFTVFDTTTVLGHTVERTREQLNWAEKPCTECNTRYGPNATRDPS